MAEKVFDLTGHKFALLTVIKYHHTAANGAAVFECLCSCGNRKNIRSDALRSGHTKSCGCLRKTRIQLENPISQEEFRNDGHSKTRLYRVYAGMLSRCNNPNNKSFKDYGGRGITVCDEWRNDYSAFRDWAVVNGYDSEAPYGQCTIDRINVDGNYEPSNCRWVTMAVQNKNKRPIHKKVTT